MTYPGTYDGLLSLVTLPNGKTYEIEDYYARQLASGGLSFQVSKNAASTPSGVTWDNGGTTVTGTLTASADTKNKIYLVPQKNAAGKDIFAEYITVEEPSGTFTWEKLGDTDIGGVTLSKVTDNVLGEDTTASGTLSNTAVTVTPSTMAFTKASAVTAIDSDDDTFVKSYPGATSKLVLSEFTPVNGTETITPVNGTETITPVGGTTDVTQVTIDNASVNTTYLATDPAAVSTWSFTTGAIQEGSGSGTDPTTEVRLIIGGANGAAITRTNGTASKVSAATSVTVATAGSDVTLAKAGTAVTVAKAGSAVDVVTGIAANGTGATVMTGLGTPTTASALTSITPTTSAANYMVTTAAAGNVVNGITSANVTNGAVAVTIADNDIVSVLTDATSIVVS